MPETHFTAAGSIDHCQDRASHDQRRHTLMRLGVAGPVGTGKSSLIALICRELAAELSLGVITNDIYTDEDARFLRSAGVLDPERIRAVETGACPHTAIRDDVTANLLAVEDLEADFAPLDVVLVESGGDNLTATFSPALVDAQIFVLDVAGGGDVARKGGPGIGRADLLVVNKTDLGPYVGVDVPTDGRRRSGGPRRPAGDRAVPARSGVDRRADRLGPWVLASSGPAPTSRSTRVRWRRTATPTRAGAARVHVHASADAPHAHAGSGDGPHDHARVTGAALADARGVHAAHVHQPDGGRGGTAVRRCTRTKREQPTGPARVTRIAVQCRSRAGPAGPDRRADRPARAQVTETGARVGLVATTALLLGGDHVEIDIDVGPGAWLEVVEIAGTVAYDADGVASSLDRSDPGRGRRRH